MSTLLPVHTSNEDKPKSFARQQAEGKWRYWYSAIIDLMIEHPEYTLKDIARELGRTPQTISSITGTDMFKAQLRARRDEWTEKHDAGILARTTKIAELALDGIIENLEKRRDKVPLPLLNEITDTALERLGYGTDKTPLVQVNNTNVDNSQKTVSITTSDLAEAREVMRSLEQRRNVAPLPPPEPLPVGASVEAVTVEAEPTSDKGMESFGAPPSRAAE